MTLPTYPRTSKSIAPALITYLPTYLRLDSLAKPRRRFVPQLIEETTRSSSSNPKTNSKASPSPSPDIGTDNPRTTPNAAQATRDVSAQTKDSDTSATQMPTKPIRRFAPVPIETTFDSYRVANKNPHGPAPEPTPDPSPTTSHSSPAFEPTAAPIAHATIGEREQEKRPRRRFAPQLIETTRRTWRAGQQGPATKPIDKTDITPGTNHIYVPKPKRKQGAPGPSRGSAGLAQASSESEDEALPNFLSRRLQRSMKIHPNSRGSTRNNSYHPELDTILSSESGNSSEDDASAAAPVVNSAVPALSDSRSDHGDTWSTRSYELRDRRESCDEEISGYLLGIAAREAHRQREFEQALSAFPNGIPPQGVEHFFVRDNSEDDLQIGDDEPPLRHGPSQLLRRTSTDPGWAVEEMRAHAEKLARMRAETQMSLDDNSDHSGMASPPEDPLWTTRARRESRDSAIGGSMGPVLPTQSPMLFARSPPRHEKHFSALPSTGLRASPFGMPFAFHASKPDDGELGRMRKAASPPMLGSDLTFRSCRSPQYTRMEPNQPYSQFDRLEKNQRDTSGATGLWRGYCSAKTSRLDAPALQPPDLLHTPGALCSTTDPFDSAFGTSMDGSGMQSPSWAASSKQMSLHKQALSGLGERLEKEMARKERQEAMLAEFDDVFVTQVYNYLSLGYPSTARAFDDELCKISGICVEELRKDDNVDVGKGFMLQMEISPGGESGENVETSDSSSVKSSGEGAQGDEKRSHHKTPRWRALKLYVREWARQHPSLDSDDDLGPPAWGVRARRGSWAI
ncbi:hypothetical protein F5B17DRAFT_440692 [Nemania serpens]|nr:hypothetical protein F5B17DRAFT_440692 [Nemania serpens]